MTATTDDRRPDGSTMDRCAACHARLAHDQRYCVECGTRRGPMPAAVSELVGGVAEQGQGATPVPVPIGPAGRLGAAESTVPRPFGAGVLTPRTGAIAVMGMLAFGVAVGSAVGGSSVVSLAGAPLVLIAQGGGPAALPSAVLSAAGVSNSGSSGGSSGGPQTITVTTPAPQQSQSAAGTTPATTSTSSSTSTTSDNLLGLPPIQHIFMIVLSDRGYSQTFGSKDPYLARTLPRQGKLLEYYYAVAGGPLANEVALVSGQGPTRQTVLNCPRYTNITPAGKGREEQVLGNGCVYPKRTQTLADQLTAAHYTWKAYVQGMASGPPGQAKTCRHPALGHADSGVPRSAGDGYVTWRNPFVYFQSLTSGSACRDDDVDLTQLTTDLKSAGSTPNFSYIVADPCDDGSDQPCAPHAKFGLGPADAFLRSVVPEIQHSAAFKADGLIIITFDQAPQTGPDADPSACCDNPTSYPNLPAPATTTTTTTTPSAASDLSTTDSSTPSTTSATAPATTSSTAPAATSTSPSATATTSTTTTSAITTTTSPTGATTSATTTTTTSSSIGNGETTPTGGGGQVGLLLISQYVKPNTVDNLDYYNHYALLRSIENIFSIGHIGYATDLSLQVFDSSTFDG